MAKADDRESEGFGGAPGPDFESMALADLIASADVSSSAADEAFDYATEKKRAKIDRAKAENEMRLKFFNWASRLAARMILANFVIFAIYLFAEIVLYKQSEVLPAGVMVAWTGATVVEIIGIVAIIANYLFPGRRAASGEK